jgi:phospholipid/cholesterol/gamma-HCH transport system ATP-binding protein
LDGRLAFERVEKSFGATPVLRGLSAEIDLSQLTYVIGKSGSGKSVLCRLAVGLLRPDSGRVLLADQPVHALPERALSSLRRQVPYLVQGPALLDWLTVGQNVAMARRGAAAEEVGAALERVGLSGVAERLPRELGPGIQKRVAIARALLLDPGFLLLDEPTTGLDRVAARKVTTLFKTLREQGLGALVVSHDYRALEASADRVLAIAEGEVAFFGTPSELFASTAPGVRELVSPGERGARHG